MAALPRSYGPAAADDGAGRGCHTFVTGTTAPRHVCAVYWSRKAEDTSMTKTWLRIAGTALGVALVAGAGLATVAAREQGPGGPRGAMGRRGPGGPGGAGGPVALPLGGLGLTETQREQVKTAMDGHKGEFDAIRTRMQTARTALQQAVTADAFDEATVRQKSVDVAAVEADAAVLRAKVHSRGVGAAHARTAAEGARAEDAAGRTPGPDARALRTAPAGASAAAPAARVDYERFATTGYVKSNGGAALVAAPPVRCTAGLNPAGGPAAGAGRSA